MRTRPADISTLAAKAILVCLCRSIVLWFAYAVDACGRGLRLSTTEAKCRYESLQPSTANGPSSHQVLESSNQNHLEGVPAIIDYGCRAFLPPGRCSRASRACSLPHPEESRCTPVRVRVEAFIGHFSKGYDLIVYDTISYALYCRLGGLGCLRLTHELARMLFASPGGRIPARAFLR